jgi:hypothetical protein
LFDKLNKKAVSQIADIVEKDGRRTAVSDIRKLLDNVHPTEIVLKNGGTEVKVFVE